jgi:hypothetical protein
LLFARRTKRDGSHPYVAIEFRDLFTDDERYDVPARTTARQIRDRVDAALEAIAECQEIIESQRVSETDNSRQAIWDQSSALFAFVANKLTDEGNDDRMD